MKEQTKTVGLLVGADHATPLQDFRKSDALASLVRAPPLLSCSHVLTGSARGQRNANDMPQLPLWTVDAGCNRNLAPMRTSTFMAQAALLAFLSVATLLWTHGRSLPLINHRGIILAIHGLMDHAQPHELDV